MSIEINVALDLIAGVTSDWLPVNDGFCDLKHAILVSKNS